MSIVLRTLQGRRFVDVRGPVRHRRRGPPVLVVTFIAMLELAREHLLEVTQAEAFAPIYVRLAYTPSLTARATALTACTPSLKRDHRAQLVRQHRLDQQVEVVLVRLRPRGRSSCCR